MTRNRHTQVLVASTLINTGGDGLYIAGSALFFTKGLGLPVAQVGLALTCAGLLGLTAGIPIGRLADRHSPRDILILIQLVQAAAIGSYVLVGRSLPAFIAVATVVIAGMQGADAAKGALVGQIGRGDPVTLRALMQSVSNIGISAGTVCAGFLIVGGTHFDYQLLMLADAGSFLAAAVLLVALPRVSADGPAATAWRGRRWIALRDRPYLALTTANCVMSLQYFVLAFAMPLWVIGHTSAPRWLISPMLLTNTVLIVVLQVRFSRGAKRPEGAGRSARRAGAVLAVAMILYAAAAGRAETAAIALLLAAVMAHSVGELLQSSGSFGISYGLAARDALGEYLGVYGLGMGICRAVAPAILAFTCLQHGTVGWIALAVGFGISGLATPALVRWAGRCEADTEPEVERAAECDLGLASSC
ncbi:MAG: MFS transporter [Actinomycetota bacterium]|nr:MFS transporter [Actinomycetota bacterium]